MKILDQLLKSTAQIILKMLIINPILVTPNFVNVKLTCKMHQSYMPKWDKIYLSVYLRQILHGPNSY